MNEYLNDLNLIDLLSEKHKKLRKHIIEVWLESKGEHIAETEAYMLSMLEIKSMTVAETARKIDVSRQAAHKCARKLIDAGYVTMNSIEGNNRDKLIVLTKKGEEFCKQMLLLKQQVEEEIGKNIGCKNLEMMKTYLRKDWLD